MKKTQLADNILILMAHHHIENLNELSNKCGIPQSSFHRILHSGSMPSLSNAVRIADFFGVMLDTLVRGNPLDELNKSKVRLVPIVNLNDAHKISVNNLNQSCWEEWIATSIIEDKNAFAFEIDYHGLPLPFTNDSTHIVSTTLSPESDDVCIINKDKQSNVLRRAIIDGKQLVTTPLYNSNLVEPTNLEKVIGIVVSSIVGKHYAS